jgi:cation transporter-like permease
MISNSERHFMNHWNEQKSGPLWKYYLQFTFAWTVVSFLVIFFLTKLFTDAWETGGKNMIILFVAASVVIGLMVTHFTYTISEKRYKEIIKREEGERN